MVSILPADDAFCRKAAQKWGLSGKDAACFVAGEGGRLLGYIVYTVEGAEASLAALESESALLGDGLVRAALSAARDKGVHTAVCRNAALFSLLKPMGFEQSGGPGASSEMRGDIRIALRGRCQGSR